MGSILGPPIYGNYHLDWGCKPPRPSYPQLGPKYPLLGTIYPQLRVQGGSWQIKGKCGGSGGSPWDPLHTMRFREFRVQVSGFRFRIWVWDLGFGI